MSSLKKILRTVRPFLGKIDVEIDRTRQIIYFRKNGQTETLTISQLYDEIESIFQVASKATGEAEAVGAAANKPSWLPAYRKPVRNPLGNHEQALIEPARPLAGPES